MLDGKVQLWSTYTIMKPVKKMINEYKIKNIEYGKELLVSPAANRESLSQNLERNEEGQVVLKDNTKIPKLLFGACLPLDMAMDLILDRLGKIVA